MTGPNMYMCLPNPMRISASSISQSELVGGPEDFKYTYQQYYAAYY